VLDEEVEQGGRVVVVVGTRGEGCAPGEGRELVAGLGEVGGFVLVLGLYTG